MRGCMDNVEENEKGFAQIFYINPYPCLIGVITEIFSGNLFSFPFSSSVKTLIKWSYFADGPWATLLLSKSTKQHHTKTQLCTVHRR